MMALIIVAWILNYLDAPTWLWVLWTIWLIGKIVLWIINLFIKD
jgi:hypothetical protein